MTPTLPTAAEDWPLSLHAACAQLLHRAHIPADLFGDLLNAHYGSPQVVLTSGFVVPAHQFEQAIALISDAGLPQCRCETSRHRADPSRSESLPAHFPIPHHDSCVLYLCPSTTLSELLPVQSTNNPLGLRRQPWPLVSPPSDDSTLSVLDPTSLVRVLLALFVLSDNHRDGLGLSYKVMLRYFATLRLSCDPSAAETEARHASTQLAYSDPAASASAIDALRTLWKEQFLLQGSESGKNLAQLKLDAREAFQDLTDAS